MMIEEGWQRVKRWLNIRIWGTDIFHYHTWDTGHYWYDTPTGEFDSSCDRDSDSGFYYQCTVCGEKKIVSYPC